MQRSKKIYGSIFYHLIIGIIGIAILYPILWLISSSFKAEGTIFRNAHSLIPSSFTLKNYITGWAGFGEADFGVFFKNSFIITTLATIGQIFTSAAVAYGFARIKFRGKSLLFALMISTLLLPHQVIMVPQYIMFSNMGWIDSFLPLILPRFLPERFLCF